MHIITVQNTLEDVVRDVQDGTVAHESVWISRRLHDGNQELFYFDVALSPTLGFSPAAANTALARPAPQQYILTVDDDHGRHVYRVQMLRLVAPVADVSAVALSPNDDYLIVGLPSGALRQYNVCTHAEEHVLPAAHYSGVSKIAVLPSAQVVMSVGDDFQTKLWAVPPNAPTRTFRGQRGPITDVALIARGRNFLTASQDGSVVLRECALASVVCEFRQISNAADAALCIALGRCAPAEPAHTVHANRLFGCDGVAMYVGYALGRIQQYNVAGHFATRVRYDVRAPVLALVCGERYLVAGLALGELRVWRELAAEKVPAEGSDLSEAESWSHVLPGPIDHVHILSETPRLSVLVSAGADVLLRVDFDGEFFATHIGGFQELSKVVLIAANKARVVVATGTELGQL